MVITTERLILREMRQGDAAELLTIFQHPLFFYAAALQDNIPFDQAAQRYAGWAETSLWESPRKSWFMSILLKESNAFLGAVVLVDLAETIGIGRQIEIGYFINVTHQNRGYATEAAYAMRDFAKKDLKVSSIYTTVDPNNLSSRSILEKLGLREAGCDDGRYVDRDGNPSPRLKYRGWI